MYNLPTKENPQKNKNKNKKQTKKINQQKAKQNKFVVNFD